MKKLFEIVSEKNSLIKQREELKKAYEKSLKILNGNISELERLESLSQDNNIEKIQLAETVLYVYGNPYGSTSDSATIAQQAINDIAIGCTHLRKEFFGNKRYDGYYQGSDHPYGYGPKHGSICDEIGLRPDARKRELTDDEKDACIYYLKNYQKIAEQKKATA